MGSQMLVEIPFELQEQLRHGNVLLFLGEGINHGPGGVPDFPTQDELAAELASRCDYPDDAPLSLSQVAQFYEDVGPGRQSLVSCLRDRLDRPDFAPGKNHHLIARLPVKVIVTTCYESLMEQALRAAMKATGVSLFSLESRRPLASFDVIGVSLPYEQLYTNLLNMLDLARLPVWSADRDERHPLVIAGGGAAFNPEPVSGFVDAFVLGDGEEVVFDITQAVREAKRLGSDRQAVLRRLATIQGVYVPSLYQVDYRHDGTVAGVHATSPEARLPVRKRIAATLPPPVTRPLVPYIDTIHTN